MKGVPNLVENHALTREKILQAAIIGYQKQLAEVEADITELRKLLDVTVQPEPKKRVFSAAARKRMSQAQKRRYRALKK